MEELVAGSHDVAYLGHTVSSSDSPYEPDGDAVALIIAHRLPEALSG